MRDRICNGSWDKYYLLSLEELMCKESDQAAFQKQLDELLIKASVKLDDQRLKKLEHLKSGKKQIESMGAGLLLQLAVQEALAECSPESWGNNATDEMIPLSLSQLLEKVQSPLPLEYTYGERGKPYLKKHPFYFSISHSGNYVFCVISNQEVGADLQYKTQQVNERVLQRFFAPEEKVYWEQCHTDAEQRDFFYRMWCRKEAYGKLTGEGIGDAVSVNMYFGEKFSEEQKAVFSNDWTEPKKVQKAFITIKEYDLSDDYQIAVCKWK